MLVRCVVVMVILSVVIERCLAARKSDITNCPLCDYVYTDDGYFSFTEVDSAMLLPGVTSYKLNVTSLKWNDETFSSRPVWRHTVIVNVPHVLHHQTAFISFVGVQLQFPIDLSTDRDTVMFLAGVSLQTKSVSAIAYNIPNAKITFYTPNGSLELDSDESIAYTNLVYNQFPVVTNTIISPTVKASMKAMDAVQQFMATKNHVVDRFVVQGASKRAVPAYICAAMDDRVVGSVPTVANFISTNEYLLHVYNSLNGAWPFYFGAWKEAGLLALINQPENHNYVLLTDPINYVRYITVPKLLVVVGQDDLFPPDNSFLYFNQLVGEVKFWIVENSGHFMQQHPRMLAEYFGGVQAFYQSILNEEERPKISWRKKVNARGVGKIVLKVSEEPAYIAAIVANSVVNDRRDFRRFIICLTCPAVQLCQTCPPLPLRDTGDIYREDVAAIKTKGLNGRGTRYRYVAKYRQPATGYLQFYIKMKFANGLIFTTESLILPDTYPTTAGCSGEACTAAPLV